MANRESQHCLRRSARPASLWRRPRRRRILRFHRLARLPCVSRLDQGNEAEPGDLGDLCERLAEFGRRVLLESLGELLYDARAIERPYRDNERGSELWRVGGGESLKPGEFLGRTWVGPRTRLLLRRVVGDLAANRRPAGKLRVRAQEFELARL